MGCARDIDRAQARRQYHESAAKLRNSVIRQFHHLIVDGVSGRLKPQFQLSKVALPARQKARDILHHAGLRFKFENKTKKLANQRIASIAPAVILRQSRESLARRAARDQIQSVASGQF